MDRASVIGIILALVAIFGGFLMEGGHLGAIVQPTAALIVFGGTLGALFLQFPMEHMRTALGDLSTVFVRVETKPLRELQDLMLTFAKTAHREGLLPLEREIETIDDSFLKKALTLALDGAAAESVRHSLELDLDTTAEQNDLGARVFEAGGGYAPTVGILGAVLGLIHVMENLSDPDQLGGGIAVAFVATVYGVGLANLVLLPIAGKIRVRNQVLFQRGEFIIEGITAIVKGEHPTTIHDRLDGMLGREDRQVDDASATVKNSSLPPKDKVSEEQGSEPTKEAGPKSAPSEDGSGSESSDPSDPVEPSEPPKES